MAEEKILIRKLREGDLTAFREIVENHKERIYYLALDLTGSHADAEDLSQEVFIKAFRSVQKFRGDAKISTWLYRITINTFIDQRRKKKFQLFQKSEKMNSDQSTDIMADQVDNAQNPERDAESNLIQTHIENALKKLFTSEKTVFWLKQTGVPSALDAIVEIVRQN